MRNNTPFDKNNRHETGGRGGDGTVVFTFYGSPVYFPLTTTAPNGSVIPASGSYAAGSVVSVSAVPNPGYRFTGWTGDLSGTLTPQTLIMNGSRSATANFVRTHTLTTNAGSGGSISPASGSIHDENTIISVEAIAAPGYRFVGWSGALTGTQTTATLTMDGDLNLDASFELIIPAFRARISGNDIILSWPVLSPGWMLQWSAALEQGSWQNLSGPYQTNGIENSWQEPASDDRRFFRLMHP